MKLKHVSNVNPNPMQSHAIKTAFRFASTTLLAGFLVLSASFFPAAFQVQTAEAAAGVPYAFSYQGRLYDNSGNLLGGAGTTYCFRFSLWDHTTPGSGTRLWPTGAPGNTQLTVTNGVFSANVGIDTADALTYNFYDNDTVFLQVEVATYSGGCGSFETLSPRKQMVASGYAINSDLLDGATSGTGADNILKLDASGNIGLTASNPSVRASSTNTLTVQGGGATGDVQFFSSSNRITSSGVLTLAGGANLGGGVAATSGNFSSALTGTTGVFAPTTDAVSLQVRQTSAGSPTSDIFQVENSSETAQYLKVTSSGSVAFAPAAGQDLVMSMAAGSQTQVVATAAPTTDLFTVTNAGQATTTANANGIFVDYVGGAAAVEGSGMQINVNPGSTSGGTWNGLKFVANSTGAASGVDLNGILLEGPASPGAGTETAIAVGTGWDVGLSLQSGGMQLTEISDPSAPASDTLLLYVSDVAGSTMIKVKDASGTRYALQPSLFENNVVMITPNGSTTLNTVGTDTTSFGTLSHPAASQTTGYMTNFLTGASSGDTAGTGTSQANFFRGSTAGANGFFTFSRLYFPDTLADYAHTSTGSRIFVGMTDQDLDDAVASDDPAGHRAGFSLVPARDTATFNWKFSTKDGSTESVADTGVAFAVGKVYDFYVYTPPQGSTIYWRIDNLTDNTSTSGSTSSNLPAGSTAMRAGFQVGTLNAVAKNVRMQRLYIGTNR